MSIEGKRNITAHSAGKGQEACTQYGALCWRQARDKVEVLLVTSRDTGRWIIPKGWPIKGLGPAETAQQEAFEEAGVDGKLYDHCAGLYSYTKVLGEDRSGGVPCVVAVYPIRVRKLIDKFPECDQRRRKWFSPKKAAQKVDEPELRELLRGFEPAAAKAPAPRKAG